MSRGKVFLTGASGFLGSHIAAQLLEAGYLVKASFRNEAKSQAFKAAFPGKVLETCVVPDITASGAYNGSLDGADYVVHCASPFTFSIENIQKDLIDPALKGTNELLRAVAACPTVKRIVLTSSFASVVDPTKGPRPGYKYTEADWNPMTPERALENNLFGYQASKTFAEKAAWDFIESHPSVSLVTICPPMIFGPPHPSAGITRSNPNESSAQLLNAIEAAEPAATRMPVFVDVRDVASIHVSSLDIERLPSSERFLVCAGKFTWLAVKDIYQEGNVSLSSLESSEAFYSIGCEKVEAALGVKWTSLEQSIQDCLTSFGVESKWASQRITANM